jgi:membrane protease YdiL (CAAX protease family)
VTKTIVRDIFLRIPIALIGFWWVHKGRFPKMGESSISFSLSSRLFIWLGIGLLPPLFVVAMYWISGWVLPPYLAFIPLNQVDQLIIVAFASAVSASIIEEVLFRGYLFKVFEQETNLRTAIIVPSLLFGFVHIATLPEFSAMNIILITLSGTLIGIFFSLVVLLTRRVESAIGLHFMWNFLFSKGLIEFYSTRPAETNNYLSLFFTTDNPLITGGAASIQVGIPAISTYLIAIVLFIMIVKYKNVTNIADTRTPNRSI